MAKVKIQGNTSGTGTLTLTAPNTNSDRTITLPDSTGNILMSDGDGSSLTGIETVTKSATAPSSPSAGDMWFNTSSNTVSDISSKDAAIYNGTEWKTISNKVPLGTINAPASSPSALKLDQPNVTSGNYYIDIPNHGVELVYIDYTVDDGRGFVIWVSYHFTNGQQRWPGSTWEYMFGGSGSGGYTAGGFTGGNGVRTNARLDPTWLANMGVNGTGLTVESNDNGTAEGGIASSNCYSWLSFDKSASEFHSMFDNLPGQYEWGSNLTVNGNTNNTLRVQRATNVSWAGAHGSSNGVLQMAITTNVNASGFMEFLGNWGTDPNHSWTVRGTGGMTYRGGGATCDYHNRWATFGWHW